MKELSFEDLLKQPAQRVMRTSIEGLGVVTITELTGAEQEKLQAESAEFVALQEAHEKRAEEIAAALDNDGADPADFAEEQKAMREELEAKDEQLLNRWAARFLAGKECDQSEIDKLASNLSAAVRRDIYFRGLRFNIASDAYREEVQKNS